jgi:hypothetical protein
LVLAFLEAEGDKNSATKLITTDAGHGYRIALAPRIMIVAVPLLTAPIVTGAGRDAQWLPAADESES